MPLHRDCHSTVDAQPIESKTNEEKCVIAKTLESIYDEMRSRQLKAIREAGSLRSDPYFVPDSCRTIDGEEVGNHTGAIATTGTSNGKVDERRCFAISSVIDESVNTTWTKEYHKLEERLRDEFGKYGVLFSQTPSFDCNDKSSNRRDKSGSGGQLHWTLMQLVGFNDYDAEVAPEESKFTSDQYVDCIRDSLTVGGLDTSVDVTYIGVIAVATGLLMIGVPSSDVNHARDAIRNRLSRRDLPLHEPFVNDIVHSTIFRVTGDPSTHPPDLHTRLLDLASEFEHSVLGTVALDRFQVGSASWRMLREEVAATPPLRVWTLSSKTPKEHYDSVLCSEGGANHYTVSGASGTKLAMELKRTLSRGKLAGSQADLNAVVNTAVVNTSGELGSMELKRSLSRSALADPVVDGTSLTSSGGDVALPIMDLGPSWSVSVGDDDAAGEDYYMDLKIDGGEPAATGSCFTVSGASGAKLAMELRRTLSRSTLTGSQTDLATVGTTPGENETLPIVGVAELRKQIEEEGKALKRLYNIDFY
mmetsp:Transcript_48511/g.94832  ORF Transcript_48511/g.94832 Transcript_48511/m.94832 type:complete len:532 (+) Transcript_48511:111-1706(+)